MQDYACHIENEMKDQGYYRNIVPEWLGQEEEAFSTDDTFAADMPEEIRLLDKQIDSQEPVYEEIISAESEAVFIEKRVFTCGLCGREFHDSAVIKNNTTTKIDSELRGCDEQSLKLHPHYIHTCPFCGYTDYTHQYKVEGEARSRITEYFFSTAQDRDWSGLQGHVKYQLAAHLLFLKGAHILQIANAFLFAAWCADDAGEQQEASFFRERALRCYCDALENANAYPEDIPSITYRNGELCRRLGRFEEALEWFARVKTKDSRLAQLCDRQMVRAMERDRTSSDASDLFCQKQEEQSMRGVDLFEIPATGEPDHNLKDAAKGSYIECADLEEAQKALLKLYGDMIIKKPDGSGFWVAFPDNARETVKTGNDVFACCEDAEAEEAEEENIDWEYVDEMRRINTDALDDADDWARSNEEGWYYGDDE